MASVTATIQIESAFDLILKQGWEVEARGRDGAVNIRIHGDGQSREGVGASFVEAYRNLIEQENTDQCVSTEGAAWAMESAGAHAI